jgi:Leucine-rich repeat (LRR) protein
MFAIRGVVGKHLDSYNLNLVKAIIIDDKTIFNIPFRLQSRFPNLKEIKLNKVPMRKLINPSTQAEREYENVEYFGITNSKLEFIAKDAFSGLNSLKLIDLSGNQLQHINLVTFEGLTSVSALNLENNVCFDDGTTDNDQTISVALEKLRQSSCVLNYEILEKLLEFQVDAKLQLDEELIKSSSKMTTEVENISRDLKNCAVNLENSTQSVILMTYEIRALERELLKCLPVNGTCRYEISSNGYSCVAANIKIEAESEREIAWNGDHAENFENSNVQILVIQDLIINFMPKQIGLAFTTLEGLVIENCGLKSIFNEDFGNLNALKVISMPNNEISSLSSETFDELEALEEIDLSHNKIDSLPKGIFTKLKKISKINLNFNYLTVLKADSLATSNKIAYFSAINNSISAVEINFVWRLKKTTIIDFIGNFCGFKFDKDVGKYLDFYNKILLEC